MSSGSRDAVPGRPGRPDGESIDTERIDTERIDTERVDTGRIDPGRIDARWRDAEWLEPDGLGGFASGRVHGPRTRRYHALLLAAARPPSGRVLLVNGFEAWIDTPDGSFALTSERYAPDVVHPDGASRLVGFRDDPWPTWTFELPGGLYVEQEIFIAKDVPATVVRFRVLAAARDAGTAEPVPGPVTLRVVPFFSGRDYHGLQRENGSFRFDARAEGEALVFRPYDGVPGTRVASSGRYEPDPRWYRQFLYEDERARGLDDLEDLAAPGTWSFDLTQPSAGQSAEPAVLVFAADLPGHARLGDGTPAAERANALAGRERIRRQSFGSRLERAADAYVVRRGAGRTIIAGYPWFTDWGRDTFIALRGLAIAPGRLDVARDVLLEWAGAVSEGMLPNRFTDGDEPPEYNAVDASLWYVICVDEFLRACTRAGTPSPDDERATLEGAVAAILHGYADGTRHGIRADEDGLLLSGAPGVQLTWMDARIGEWVVTPRRGKPVEVQALWLNALYAARALDPRFALLFEEGRAAFAERFWNEDAGGLYDVIDVDAGLDGVRGRIDASFRPNQVFAVGGLPLPLLDAARARRMIDEVEHRLWTPLGLRSLAPADPAYAGRYAGGPHERDAVYHQGTVWPWLAGPFVEAWARVHGGDASAWTTARRRFLGGLRAHLATAGLGHVSEIADGDAPHRPAGCPFQAWSVAELIRLEQAAEAAVTGGRAGQHRAAAEGRDAVTSRAGASASASATPAPRAETSKARRHRIVRTEAR